jgi:hypothetical protein
MKPLGVKANVAAAAPRSAIEARSVRFECGR